MRLGVVPLLDGDSGGVYQYSLSILAALRQPGTLSDSDEVTLFVHDPKSPGLAALLAPGWNVRALSPPSLRTSMVRLIRKSRLTSRLLDLLHPRLTSGPRTEKSIHKPRKNLGLGAWFRKAGIDVMLYPVPMSISFECGVPFIFTVHDLQHRLQPHFPEVGTPDEWNAREYLFRNGIANALLVIADSETGRQDVLSCYPDIGLEQERIYALPFLPPRYIAEAPGAPTEKAFASGRQLPTRYFFYPAQFWPHKNHARLIQALALLKNSHGIRPSLVLCGSHYNWIRQATFEEVMRLAENLGISDQVHYLGFVPDADMPGLYKGATALLMPTFFGPTNIPVLEAWSADCPVMTSDIRGVRDQAGDAALLVNPESVEEMALAMLRLWNDQDLRSVLVGKGRERLAKWGPNDFSQRLSAILVHARKLVKQR